MNIQSKVAWATGILVVATLLSKVLGIFRDILLASLAGIHIEKNAYDLAFMIPDMLNHLISTGYLSITFIPLFTGLLGSSHKNSEQAWRFFSNTLNCFLVLLIPCTIFAWIWMEPLLLSFTRIDPSPETLHLAVSYSRIILPAQIFFFVGALFTAVQHYHMRFFIPALSGLIYNGAIILGGYLGRNQGLSGFAWGVLIGAFLGQLILQGWGFLNLPQKKESSQVSYRRYFWSFQFTHPLFLKYLKLTFPLILGIGPLFALEFLYRSYGPVFGTGGIAQLGYAYRIMYTVVAVFGFSIGVASYPYLAKLAKKKEHQAIQKILFTNLGNIFSLLSPILLILWFAAEPITQVLFQRGAFSSEVSSQVAILLKGFLVASIGMSSHVLIVRCFYAYEKMWLPAILTSGIVIATLPLYEWFAFKVGIQGVPIAASISTSLMVFILFFAWLIFHGAKGLSKFIVESIKTLFAFGISFSLLHIFFEKISPFKYTWFDTIHSPLLENIIKLCIFTLSTFILQLFIQRIFQVEASKELFSRFLKKWSF